MKKVQNLKKELVVPAVFHKLNYLGDSVRLEVGPDIRLLSYPDSAEIVIQGERGWCDFDALTIWKVFGFKLRPDVGIKCELVLRPIQLLGEEEDS